LPARCWADAFARARSEALIKVGSETIASRSFYECFFELVEKILAEQKGLD
jgi:hypothetical protein